MKVQRVKMPNGKITWTVLDYDRRPIQSIAQYIRYMESLDRSPNTILSYATSLKFFWEFLGDNHLNWQQITLENLADFITWLRRPEPSTISLHQQTAKRAESSINTILSAVYGFYNFHTRLGNVPDLNAYGSQAYGGRRFKSFLHHITKSKPVQTRLIKLKEPQRQMETFSQEEVKTLLDACHRLRDKFLICLLYETGMRIGQALGLRHSDIRSWDNEIDIIPRTNNANGVRAKRTDSLTVHISKSLVELYSEYLVSEYPEDVDSDYVFINIWDGKIGQPMIPRVVHSFFQKLGRKTNLDVHAHKFRHTHATDLIRDGWDMAHVQRRLGHANVQTTINTYTHLTSDDMKQAYQAYLSKLKEDE